MKILKYFIFFSLIVIGCNEPNIIEYSLNDINFLTSKRSYTELDNINIVINNKSNSDIVLFLKCGVFLEMSYQKKENNVWSDNLWFWYTSARCLTLSDTLKVDGTFNYSIPSEIFESTGEFRLLLDYYDPIEDKVVNVVSNTFEIK